MTPIQRACVISLDRGYPLVLPLDPQEVLTSPSGRTDVCPYKGITAPEPFRVQHATDLVKNASVRAAVGDLVELDFPPGQDTPLITRIFPRTHELVRRSLVESRHEGAGKHAEQVLATNFDAVAVVTALSRHPLDQDYLERQLVMAHESGSEVILWLTKADLAADLVADTARARECAPGCEIRVLSARKGTGISELATLLAGRVTVLLGRSGVGKSTVVNALMGEETQATGEVREKDRAGRHVTVARRMVFLPNEGGGGALIDTPGLRSIGLYDAHAGLSAAFPEVSALAAECRYRDCTHAHEPGCAVIAAEQAGILSARRLTSYRTISPEVAD